jgi:RHS repeat-associated protein
LDFGRGSFYPEFRGVQPQTLTHRYLHGAVVDQIFAREDVESLWQPGDVLWALTDHLGTVRDVIDSMATVVNHIRYDSFGKITSETNAAVDFLFAYTGRERDEETGLYYYRARYYDPAVGRFVSEDPMGFAAGDTNLVRYVGNGPIDTADPSGLIATREHRQLDHHAVRGNARRAHRGIVASVYPSFRRYDI